MRGVLCARYAKHGFCWIIISKTISFIQQSFRFKIITIYYRRTDTTKIKNSLVIKAGESEGREDKRLCIITFKHKKTLFHLHMYNPTFYASYLNTISNLVRLYFSYFYRLIFLIVNFFKHR